VDVSAGEFQVYLSPPDVGELERRLLLEAFDSNWVAPAGPDLRLFEQQLAERAGVRRAVALSSGTAGLHLALLVAGVDRDDEVLVPSQTFAASANAAVYVGARPVFVDSDRATWTIDPGLAAEEIERSAARRRPPAALMSVDLYGQCADYDRLLDVCQRFGVTLIEDAAEALGATYRGRPAGSFGAAAVVSFNGNKIITCGGGGVLLTDSDEFADRCRLLATQAREPVAHYEHNHVGYNYRLSNLLAAVGRAQLSSLAEKIEARRRVNRFYRSAFADVPGLEFMPVAPYGHPNYWLTCVLVRPDIFGATREDVRQRLAAYGIEARATWKPMHLQPVFRGCRTVGGAVCEDLYRDGLCLPSGSRLSDVELGRVCDVVLSVRRAALMSSSARAGA